MKSLSAADPSSALLQHGVSVSLIKLGDVLEAQGDLAGAKQRLTGGAWTFLSALRRRTRVGDPSART